MEKTKVSVIVTCYNHEKYIQKALEGIAMQETDFEYEIIIHDDASPDGSQAIIKEFVASNPQLNITTIYQTENQYSQNIRFAQVYIFPIITGDYIVACEGDDYWIDKNKLQKQVDFLDNHPEYIAIGHNCVFVDENGKEYEKKPYEIYGPFCSHDFKLNELAFGFYPGQTATIMYRREQYLSSIYKHLNEYNAIKTNGDKKRNLELLLIGNIYYDESFMSAYRVVTSGGSSWSGNNYYLNRAYKSFCDSLYCRKYVKRVFHKKFHNEFQSFYLITVAFIRLLKKRNNENKTVIKQIIGEYKNIFTFISCYLYYGIISFPRYLVHKIKSKKIIMR